MKKLIIHSELEKFLRKHRCLNVFKQNVAKESADKSHYLYSQIAKGHPHAILNAFIWHKAQAPKHTPLSSEAFWNALSYKWKYHVDE